MCRHHETVYACDCPPKQVFRKCSDQLAAESRDKTKNFKPLECPNYFREEDTVLPVKCNNCLVFEIHLQDSMGPKKPRAYVKRRISLDKDGNEIDRRVRPKSPDAGPSRPAPVRAPAPRQPAEERRWTEPHPNPLGFHPVSADEKAALSKFSKGKGVDREAHPNYPVAASSRAFTQPLVPVTHYSPPPRASTAKKGGKTIGGRVKDLLRKFEKD